MLDVYVDNYIALAMPTSQEQLDHVANAILEGIHEVLPEDEEDSEGPISLKKLLREEGMWAIMKDIRGFNFNGLNKMLWPDNKKWDALLTIIHGWLRSAQDHSKGITAKLRYAFIYTPGGKGLLSPMNGTLSKEPPFVFLYRNKPLLTALLESHTLSRESTLLSTLCKELVSRVQQFVGIKDASKHGVGGVIVRHTKACIPTVF